MQSNSCSIQSLSSCPEGKGPHRSKLGWAGVTVFHTGPFQAFLGGCSRPTPTCFPDSSDGKGDIRQVAWPPGCLHMCHFMICVVIRMAKLKSESKKKKKKHQTKKHQVHNRKHQDQNPGMWTPSPGLYLYPKPAQKSSFANFTPMTPKTKLPIK